MLQEELRVLGYFTKHLFSRNIVKDPSDSGSLALVCPGVDNLHFSFINIALTAVKIKY